MNCEQAQAGLALYLYGELSFDTEQAFERHLDECGHCRGELERERLLHSAVDSLRLDPAAAVLAASRRRLFDQLASQARPAAGPRAWLSRMGAFVESRFRWVVPAAATALIVLGFAAGRWQALSTAAGTRAASAILATRVKNVEPAASGHVRIVIEETRQRTVLGLPQEANIRDLLLVAAQDPADPGLRVESVDLLRQGPVDALVRGALVQALERDSNPGVRLKAIEALRPFSANPDVQSAFAHALLRDDNAGVRLQAVDLLTAHPPGGLAGVLQQAIEHEDNNYIRLRAQRVLHDLGASVDTF